MGPRCMSRFFLGTIAAGAALAAAAASGADAPSTDLPKKEPPKINALVGVPPHAALVERIGGNRVRVGVLIGPGQSPHTFEPTPKEVTRLAQARIFFTAGMPFEKRLLEKVKAIHPNLQVVDTREGVPLRWMTAAEAAADKDEKGPAEHPPAPGREHAGEPDPHIWLNPRYAKIQAATICRTLQAADPTYAEEFSKNLEALDKDLDRIDAKIAKALAPFRGKKFLVFHPAFGYFADAYGLKQVAVEIEGKEPSARQLMAVIARARAEGARMIFVQPQFSAKSAEAVARAIGGVVAALDPLARDYPANLETIAEKIRAALAPESPHAP